MKFRWGLIGYGDLAEKRVAAALALSGELVGVWGRNPGRTGEFAQKYGIPNACQNVDELLALGLDGLYVCTPPGSHYEYAEKGLQAGCHVLVEKPMAASVDECSRLIELAETKGVKIGVAYYRRAYPKMQHVKKLIDDGVLGTPVWVNMASHSWFAPEEGDPKRWRVEPTQSGGAGALADIGVHRLDLLDYWLGGSEVVGASFTNVVQSYKVEDGSSIMLRLANGAPVHAFFSWNSKTWMDRFEIVGSEGKIILEPLDGPELIIIRGRHREDLSIPAPENAHLPCIEDFVTASRKGRQPLCDGRGGLRATSLVEEAIRAAGR